tara:strand:+ start:1742 stop:2266 length:525 start_codon:yes stop_codon:yes gene_type:complete
MNHLNNMDIRQGLVAELRVNCNAIEQMYIDGNEKEGELEWLCDDIIKEEFWKEFNHSITPEMLLEEEELMYLFQEHLEDWKKYVIYKEYEEEDHCECDFPKFIIEDGIQSCSQCNKVDHYKCGVVADHSEDESVSPVGVCSLGHTDGEYGCCLCYSKPPKVVKFNVLKNDYLIN